MESRSWKGAMESDTVFTVTEAPILSLWLMVVGFSPVSRQHHAHFFSFFVCLFMTAWWYVKYWVKDYYDDLCNSDKVHYKRILHTNICTVSGIKIFQIIFAVNKMQLHDTDAVNSAFSSKRPNFKNEELYTSILSESVYVFQLSPNFGSADLNSLLVIGKSLHLEGGWVGGWWWRWWWWCVGGGSGLLCVWVFFKNFDLTPTPAHCFVD